MYVCNLILCYLFIGILPARAGDYVCIIISDTFALYTIQCSRRIGMLVENL